MSAIWGCFALLFIGSVVLFAAGLLPQDRIETNILNSLYQIKDEGLYPHILDEKNWACMLDVYSDYYILNLSNFMNTKKDPASIFTNPEQTGNSGEYLQAAIEQHTEPNESYPRYWGGFRAAVRFLLTFLTYPQIRRLLSILFVLLAGGSSLYLFAHTRNLMPSLSLLITLSLLNPSVISATLQFSCCFLIALAGILLLPKREYSHFTYPMYFFILGAATQYFDFYTTPILTFGLPMLSLLCIRQYKDANFTGKRMFQLFMRGFLGWLAAYLFMWVGKLTLTNIFTNFDAFSDGFGAAQERIFVSTGGVGGSWIYRVGLACWRACMRVFDKPVFFLGAILFALIVWRVLFISRKKTGKDICTSLTYLFIAALPLAWFAVASGPSIKHSWFQYRGIGVLLFGILLFISQSTRKTAALPAYSTETLQANREMDAPPKK